MLTNAYPFLYLGIVAAAVAWYLQQHRGRNASLPKAAFLLGALLYVPALLGGGGGLFYKAFVLGRDFAVLATVAIATNALAKRPKALLAFLGSAVLATNYFYFDALRNTFRFNQDLAQDAELLFDIKNHRQLDYVQEVLEPYGATLRRAFPELEHEGYGALDEYYAVDVPEEYADRLDEIKEALLASGAVDAVDENEVLSLSPEEAEELEEAPTPNDYGLNDPNLGNLWGFQQMGMAEFYQRLRDSGAQPKKKAKIFILDTGVDGSHEDLSGNYRSVDARYDRDVQGHGTHCAGIAAAVSNNGKGIASLSLQNDFVTVTSVKVLSDEGRGSQQSIVKGIIRAADAGADVISMSLGGPGFGRRHTAYEEAIAYARKAGAIVVVAAGNSNDDAADYVPASCRGVIAVSALDRDLARARFSNWVSALPMGIAAPGVDILSTLPGNRYATMSGTSMATPYVAGLLGLMKSLRPTLNTEEAYQILKETGAETKDTAKTGLFIQPAKVLERLR